MTQQIPTLQSQKASEIQAKFDAQLHHYKAVGQSSARARRQKLRSIEKWLLAHREEIHQALKDDFAKPTFETDFSEIYMVLSEIRLARKRLKRWMRDEPVRTPLTFIGTRSWIRRESKGVCLVIAPWNFPLNLALGPVVSAIAAGNTVILKPSQNTMATSALLESMVHELFSPEEVAIVQGAIPETQDLLRLPFHHIFFTGSPAVGKIVMKAAADHLTSVTLELGGKSPAVVDGSTSLKKAAKRIAWGKFFNGGQTCLAPDYVLVQEEKHDALVSALNQQLQRFYQGETQVNQHYANLVDEGHAKRISEWANDDVGRKGKHIPPTILTDLLPESPLLSEEIFGPVLPVVKYRSEEDLLAFIEARERPLSLYLFSNRKGFIRHVLNQTRSGSVGIGLTVAPFGQNELPFGGVNNSGIGKAHGWYGFDAFSNQRSVMKSTLPVNFHALVAPPYGGFKSGVLKFLMRWL